MDNQHKQIKGYRDLSQNEIDLMNEIKQKAEEVGVLVAKLEGVTAKRVEADRTVKSVTYSDNPDYRWIAIGKTHLQQGFMALVRSVAKQESF